MELALLPDLLSRGSVGVAEQCDFTSGKRKAIQRIAISNRNQTGKKSWGEVGASVPAVVKAGGCIYPPACAYRCMPSPRVSDAIMILGRTLMSGYDYDKPFASQEEFREYKAVDATAAARYGKTVKATILSNIDYKTRFGRFQRENNMKPPPRCVRIFSGYLVVRKLGTPFQYETWMPEDVFEELYGGEAKL